MMNDDVKLLLDGLKFCREHEFCDGCPLKKKCLDKDGDFDIVGASADQIEALAAEIEVVLSELEKATRERDAAVDDIELGLCCETCKHDNDDDEGAFCVGCVRVISRGNWEWRGVRNDAE